MSETGPIPPTGQIPSPPTPGPTPPIGYQGTAPVEMDSSTRSWGMFAHLSCLAGFFVPFGHVLGPLVVWLIKKNEMPFVDDQGKESLNFQITVALAALISTPLICTGIGVIVPIAIVVVGVVFGIIGGVKANSGVAYRYPWALRLIK